MIHLKRVYQKPAKEDGFRILVDRLWPRGISKQEAAIDLWMKDIAPSTKLRKWFNHESAKWESFLKRYRKELNSGEALSKLKQILDKEKTVTFVYSAKDEHHNNAAALKQIIQESY